MPGGLERQLFDLVRNAMIERSTVSTQSVHKWTSRDGSAHDATMAGSVGQIDETIAVRKIVPINGPELVTAVLRVSDGKTGLARAVLTLLAI